VTVTGGTITAFDAGVSLFGGDHNQVSHLQVHATRAKAVLLVGATDNTVRNNMLTGNADGGIGVFNEADHNVVTNNFLASDGPQAIEIGFANDIAVTHNVISRTGSGIVLESSDEVTISGNLIRHSLADACDGCGIGIQIYGNHDRAARNVILDAPRYGIEVDDFQDPGHSPATDNALVANKIIRAGIGIAIGPEAGGVVLRTLVERNLVSKATGDGIQLLGPSTGLETSTLTRNVAVNNAGHGIVTVPNTIDGGGNVAAHNGTAPQCINISCR
jgi:parallel beta-helix repeat protein